MNANVPTSLEVTGTAQRSAWLERTLPPVEKLRSDLWSIPVPIPRSPLRYVSVYVLASDSGLTLIDAGWDDDDAWSALNDGLREMGASVEDVQGCLVTHQHFDHIGLARRVREASGAWVALHPADRDAVVSPDFRERELAHKVFTRAMLHLGATEADVAQLHGRWPADYPGSTVAIPDRLVEDGELVGVPGWSLRAVHTPGHTPGHLCFVDESNKLLFAGDHILPRITPNISVWFSDDADALGTFLRSLDKISGCDVDEVLPAHEWRFKGLPERTRQLVEHHEKRLAELLDVIRLHPASAPWDLAGELTWSRSWDQYDGFMRVSAVTETMAHVVHLVRRGLIVGTDSAVPRYTAVS